MRLIHPRQSPAPCCIVNLLKPWPREKYIIVVHRCSPVSEASVVACCFSPCGQMFVTGCTRGDLKLWDTDVNLLHSEKDAHDLGVTCCSFAPQFEVGEYA